MRARARVRVLRGLYAIHISRDASASLSRGPHPPRRAKRREGGVKRLKREFFFFFAFRASSRRPEDSDHGTGGHLARSPVFMLAEPGWSDGNGQRFAHAGQGDSMGPFMAFETLARFSSSRRISVFKCCCFGTVNACARDANGKKKTRAKTIPDDYDFFFFLFAQAKKTCPKLQKRCLDFEEGR